MVQLSHPYTTTGKTIALTRWTFVSKIMSLLFNMLSRFVIAFLPRNKRLLISWPQLLSSVILEPKKIKSVTVSIVSPSICDEVMGLEAKILVFWMLSFKPDFSLSSILLRKLELSFCYCVWFFFTFLILLDIPRAWYSTSHCRGLPILLLFWDVRMVWMI